MTAKPLPIETFTPEELARLAQLRYVADEQPGFIRQVNGSGFVYLNGDQRPVRDRRILRRIEALAIPPAWTEVWICRQPEGHLQATGRDARQRKQYIYHERWRELSNLVKFWRLRHCPRFLPALRRQVSRDLRGTRPTQSRVLAGMVALLDLTSIRIGNEEYVRQNNSYGLATLRTRHVSIEGRRAVLQFRGKGGQRREEVVEDPRLVRLLAQLKQLPGAHLFQYLAPDGKPRRADALAVNDYLRERTPQPFTAKDFRTWKASALAAGMLYEKRDAERTVVRKRIINKTVAAIADELSNTPTICRKYYIHAGLLEAFLEARLPDLLAGFRCRRRPNFSRHEQILAHFMRRWPQHDNA